MATDQPMLVIPVDPKDKLQEPIPNKNDDLPAPTRIKPDRRVAKKSTTTTKSRSQSLETRIAAQLMSLNMMFLITPWREDALEPDEIMALAHALNSQAQASNTFKRVLEGALAVGSSGELISVIMLIAVKRAARHNLIPEQFAAFASGLMPESEDADTEEA